MNRSLTFALLSCLLVATASSAQQGGAQQGGTQRGGAQQGNTQQGGAQQGGVQQSAAMTAVNDSLFAAAAADSGLAEVSMSELGVQRATDPELKKFSQQMIDEHNRVNQELMTLAAQKGMALPRTVDPRAQFCAQSLAGLSGEEFDTCYSKAQLVAHMEAVSAFEAESQRGMDRDVKAFAARTLPHLKEHLEAIKPIAMKFEKNAQTLKSK
jgi:putative membrane protein